MKRTFLIATLSVWMGLVWCSKERACGDGPKPIRALLVTGGCCHDYDRQKLILTKGISARANLTWTVVHQGGKTTDTQIPLYSDPNWADGFDVVVHNECFAAVNDRRFVEGILRPHREGVPAVLIHCAMHCYRTGNDSWFQFCGVQSPRHGPHHAFTVENLAPDEPIMTGFGPSWTTPKGELYYTVKLFPHCVPLAHAPRRDNNENQVCIWKNRYGKGNVFGTTIGHHNETMAEPRYLDMLTRGLLWAAGQDPVADFKATDEKTDAAIRVLATAEVAKEPSQ
jgi:type 1 glutamine amidotransferase